MKKSILASTILAACAAFTGYAGGVISINIASDGPKMSEQSGTAPGLSGVDGVTAASWNDIVTLTQDDPAGLKVWDGEKVISPEGFAATWSFKGFYGAGDSPDLFRRHWSNTSGMGEWTIDLTGIPFKKYDIVCYMNWDGNGQWSPISVNGVKWTYDAESGRAVMGSDPWGESKWSEKTFGPAVMGVNALRIPNIVGTMLKLHGNQYANICAIQIVEVTTWNTSDALSLNFASSYGAMSEQVGLDNGATGKEILASSWNDLDNLTGTNAALKVWNGASLSVEVIEGLKAAWTIAGTYGWGNSPAVFRRGWCDTRGAGKWAVEITGIPFDEYDVYVYMNWDGKQEDSYFWSPVAVNGVDWTYDAEFKQAVKGSGRWGYAKGPTADVVLGENVICVSRVSGSTLNLGGSGNALACGIQIVPSPPADFVADDTIAARDVNAAIKAQSKEGMEFSLELPAGKAIVLNEKRPLVCSKLCIVSKGNILIDTASNPLDENGELLEWVKAELAKIDISRVKGEALHGWKPTAGVISVNFNSAVGSMSDQGVFAGAFAGEEIPAASWNDITNASGEENLKVWKGGELALVSADDSTVKLTWNADGVYFYTSGVEDNFLKGYLEDNVIPEITISGIPFEKYDLIVYLAADWGGVSYKSWEGADFNPIEVNGAKYTWSAIHGKAIQGSDYWGEFSHPVAEYGVNALRITGLTAPELKFNAGCRYRRGGIAAIQIVEPAKKRRYSAGFITTIF